SGHETDHVQRALDVLCGNPHVSYVAGDGHEAMPGDALPNRLVVRVGNGAWPMPNKDVLFTLIDLETGADASAESWAGSLTGGTAVATWPSTRARVVRVTTDARGEASVRWTLGSTPGAERPGVRAQLELHSP